MPPGGGAAARAPIMAHLELRIPTLTVWHLLSLDGPTVAALWVWFVAGAAGVRLSGREVAAMFVAVWVLYAGDRLLDGWRWQRKALMDRMEARHWFHRRHRVAFGWGIAAASGALLWLVRALSREEVVVFGLLAALLALWLGVIHTAPGKALPKEFAVGAFFAAAVFVPAVVKTEGAPGKLWVAAGMFGAVCWFNGLFIRRWESGSRGASLLIAAAALTALALGGFVLEGSALGLAAGLAAGSLLGLDLVWERVERTTLRACADAALLTPLLVALAMR